jgi:hypothetical protein
VSAGKIAAIVGVTGAGKTSFIKDNFASQCTNKKILIYATVRSDFDDFPNAIVFTNFSDFLDAALKEKDALCIIDEAFSCLPDKLNIKPDKPKNIHNKIARFLTDSRKLNRFVIIIFHALAQVPTQWLLHYLDYFIRFTTQDLLQYQIQRFKSFPNIVQNLIKFPVLPKFTPHKLKMR